MRHMYRGGRLPIEEHAIPMRAHRRGNPGVGTRMSRGLGAWHSAVGAGECGAGGKSGVGYRVVHGSRLIHVFQVGDHQQLGAVVQCKRADEAGLSQVGYRLQNAFMQIFVVTL